MQSNINFTILHQYAEKEVVDLLWYYVLSGWEQ